jgi:hypothetical protein
MFAPGDKETVNAAQTFAVSLFYPLPVSHFLHDFGAIDAVRPNKTQRESISHEN